MAENKKTKKTAEPGVEACLKSALEGAPDETTRQAIITAADSARRRPTRRICGRRSRHHFTDFPHTSDCTWVTAALACAPKEV
jgi:hypothetical protein